MKNPIKNMDISKIFKKPKFNKKLALAIALLFAAGGTGGYYHVKASGQKPEAILTLPDLAEVVEGDLSKRITASGTTQAADPVSIFIELSQEVLEVFAEVGDTVSTGQLLVTYNIADTKKELNNKLADAQVTLDNAEITLNELKTPAEGAQLIELQTQVANAEKSLVDLQYELDALDVNIANGELDVKKALKTMQDQKALLAVGGVSQYDYDTAIESYDKTITDLEQLKNDKSKKELSFTTAELSLEKAKINLDNGQNIYNDTATVNSIKKQENTVTNAKRNITSIQDEISKLTEATYSPISGTIIESNAVEGQMLTDSTVMMKVADLSNMDVTAQVSEYDIASIKVGQSVEMQSDGIEGKIYTGVVTKIEPSASSQSTMSGTETVVPITVHMDNVDDLVKPGFSFDLEIIAEDLSNVIYVPLSAVSKDNDNSHYVFAIADDGDTLIKTTVEIGSNTDEYVVIKSGLTLAQKVVASPTEAMTDASSLKSYGVEKTIQKPTNDSILSGMTGGASSGGSGAPPSGMGGGARQGGRPN